MSQKPAGEDPAGEAPAGEADANGASAAAREGTGGVGTDLHSHLVPAVDDGARSLDGTLMATDLLVAAGVGRIVTTPHLDASLTQRPDRLAARLEEVGDAWKVAARAIGARHPQLELALGFEVLLDIPDPEPEGGDLFLADTRVLLVEWPGLQVPPSDRGVLARLGEAGIQPLVAHPERFRGRAPRWEAAARWKEEGAWLQVNCGSFSGRYGPEAQEAAIELVRRGWVDCVSSDFHARPRQTTWIDEARAWFEARGAEDAWRLLSAVNPGRIVSGDAPLPVPPVERVDGVLGRLKGFFGGDGG